MPFPTIAQVDRSLRLPESEYFAEPQAKTSIALHHTVCNSAHTMLDIWRRDRGAGGGEGATVKSDKALSDNELGRYAAISERRAEIRFGRDEIQSRRDEIRFGRDEIRFGRHEIQSRRDEIHSRRDEIQSGHDQVQSCRDEIQFRRDEIQSGHTQCESPRDEIRSDRHEIRFRRHEVQFGPAELDRLQSNTAPQ